MQRRDEKGCSGFGLTQSIHSKKFYRIKFQINLNDQFQNFAAGTQNFEICLLIWILSFEFIFQ